MYNKISIIGAGNVGATTAQFCLAKNLGKVVLLDKQGSMARDRELTLFE